MNVKEVVFAAFLQNSTDSFPIHRTIVSKNLVKPCRRQWILDQIVCVLKIDTIIETRVGIDSFHSSVNSWMIQCGYKLQ